MQIKLLTNDAYFSVNGFSSAITVATKIVNTATTFIITESTILLYCRVIISIYINLQPGAHAFSGDKPDRINGYIRRGERFQHIYGFSRMKTLI